MLQDREEYCAPLWLLDCDKPVSKILQLFVVSILPGGVNQCTPFKCMRYDIKFMKHQHLVVPWLCVKSEPWRIQATIVTFSDSYIVVNFTR